MRSLTNEELRAFQIILEKKRKRLKDSSIQTLNACIYARKSSEDKTATSIPTQIDYCRGIISSCNLLALSEENIFHEDNVSGMFVDRREEFQKMMALVQAKEIDVIVAMKYDRFARSLKDTTHYVDEVIQNGAILITSDSNIDNSPSGEFMKNILWAFNQYHAERSATDVMSALYRNAEQCRATGKAPYGYKYIDKKYAIDEEKAPVVALIFDRLANHKTYEEIIAELTLKGYYTDKKRPFCKTTIQAIARNERYAGTYIYNETGAKKKKNRVLKQYFPEVRIKGGIDCNIVTMEQFQKVQSILDSRGTVKQKSNTHSEYFLSGMVYCKKCGGVMCGHTSKSSKGTTYYRYYRCARHKQVTALKCPTLDISAVYMERLAKDLILSVANNDPAIQSAIKARINDRVYQEKALKKRLQREVTELTQAMEKLAVSISLKSGSDRFIQTLQQKYTERENMLVAKETLLKTVSGKVETLSAMAQAENDHTFTESLFKNHSRTRSLIRLIIEKITIDSAMDDIELDII